MRFVEPIRDRKKLEVMKAVLKSKSLRNYAIFVLGINSGLRVSDLLNLKVRDVFNGQHVKDRVEIYEQKTKKYKSFPLSNNVKRALKEYCESAKLAPDDPLFKSNKGGKLSRVQVWRVLNEAAKTAGIDEKIGTHTMRKTFGYQAYKSGVDVYIIQDMLNHSTPAVTKRYIGLSQEDKDRAYIMINL